jgi:hypothetical protein
LVDQEIKPAPALKGCEPAGRNGGIISKADGAVADFHAVAPSFYL